MSNMQQVKIDSDIRAIISV